MMSLRVKLLFLSVILALIPLGIAGTTMIRITRDELKSTANDNLIAAAGQVTQEIENVYEYTWMGPLRLIKKVLESKTLGAKEKLALLTDEMKSVSDLVSVQISVEGASSPVLITQDEFSAHLKSASLNPVKILEMSPGRIAGLLKQHSVFVGDLTYLDTADIWLLTVIFRLDEKSFDRPAALCARISFDHLIRRIQNNPFAKIGSVSLIDANGRYIFNKGNLEEHPKKITETVKSLLAANIRTMGTELSALASGERILGAYAFPNHPALGVIVEISEAKAYLAVTKMIRNFVMWIIAGFSIAVAGAIVVSVSLTGSLRKLTEAARKISKGDFSVSSDIQIRSKDEVGALAKSFIEMTEELEDSYRKLADHNKILEQKVDERTKALNRTLEDAKNANKKLLESISYAKMIQFSMLPNPDEMRNYFPDSFLIWLPRDIVGGDFVYADAFGDGFIIIVVDCTGHGVPGAFMTMVAFSALQRIIVYESCYNPAEILKRMNRIVKASLQQDTDYAISDDGMDAAICFLSNLSGAKDGKCLLTYAGARMPILYNHQDKIIMLRGDKQSIGYKKSDPNFDFTNHEIPIKEGMSFYMYSDGFVDQLDEEESQKFGTKRLKALATEAKGLPFEKQRDMFLRAFYAYKGTGERQDDVTVAGFGF